MSELVNVQSDSGRADPRTMITWPGAEVAQRTIRLTTMMVHWQTFTINGFKWKMVVCRCHSLFLQRSMSTGTKIATCQLTRASAASWVDFTDNQSTLTVACSCCACRNILQMHAATTMSPEIALLWVRGLPGPPTSRIISHTHAHTYKHTIALRPSWIFSETTRVSQHQKGKTSKVKWIWIYWSKR